MPPLAADLHRAAAEAAARRRPRAARRGRRRSRRRCRRPALPAPRKGAQRMEGAGARCPPRRGACTAASSGPEACSTTAALRARRGYGGPPSASAGSANRQQQEVEAGAFEGVGQRSARRRRRFGSAPADRRSARGLSSSAPAGASGSQCARLVPPRPGPARQSASTGFRTNGRWEAKPSRGPRTPCLRPKKALIG